MGMMVYPNLGGSFKGGNMNKYYPLYLYLSRIEGNYVKLSVSEIEHIISNNLPASASKYRAWWADDKTHVQAIAWMNAGWKVKNVKLGEYVEFMRQ